MENNKRKLLPYEKALFGLKIFLLAVSLFFLILYCIYDSSWAIAATWMCICVAHIADACIRWEEHTKTRIIGICAFGAFFILTGYLLVRSLL